MDYLSYNLVEEIVSYLPRPDVKTIARVASRSPELNNWSAMADDQLERRLLLDVYVRLQGFEREEGKKAEKNPRISVLVQKRLSDGRREQWDFIGWRYAWIHDMYITATLDEEPSEDDAPIETFKESNIHQAMRLVSLPVDPKVRSSLHIKNYCYSDLTPANLVELFWKTIGNTRKEFVTVDIDTTITDTLGSFDPFVAQSFEQGAFLENLTYYGNEDKQGNVNEAIAPLFGKARGRPLNVYLPSALNAVDMKLIIDAWFQSDGTFEEKGVEWAEVNEPIMWDKLKYKNIVQTRIGGYLAHPTRSSSLFIAVDQIRVLKFEPWHVPVDFEWIDGLIERWRSGHGYHIYRGRAYLHFNFKGSDDLLKLVEKYGLTLDGACSSLLGHPINPMLLQVTRFDSWFGLQVHPVTFTLEELEEVISDWMKGNGDTLINGLTKMEVWVRGYSHLLPSLHHPLGNTRCLISAKYILDYALVKMCTVPEEVEDWNLELLFGQLEV